MQTSRFQLGLIASLAMGLGLALDSSDAIGYPAGAAISHGSNPVWSVGGAVSGDGSVVLALDTPAGQVAVVTDLVFSVKHRQINCAGHVQFDLRTTDGTAASMAVQVSSWTLQRGDIYARSWGYGAEMNSGPSVLPVQFSSGVQVSSSDTLTLDVIVDLPGSCAAPTSLYTVSGYFAQG